MKTILFRCIGMLFFFMIVLFQITAAQKAPIEWGEIPKEDLKMTSYPQDTNAAALILCNFGESHFDNEFNIICNIYMRIKIFTTKGYEWGTHSIRFTKGVEFVNKIEGATYSLDNNGKVIVTELDGNDIFEEKMFESQMRYKFTLPAMKPGCIIEMRYTIKSEDISRVRNWIFQSSEPTRWSEYILRFPGGFNYAAVNQGSAPYAIHEMNEVRLSFSGFAEQFFGNSYVRGIEMHWAVKDIPALREEPYITTMDDYVKKIDIQLAGYPNKFGAAKTHLSDWPTLITELLQSEAFGERIDVTTEVKNIAEAVTAQTAAPEEKLRAIYKWVSQSITYNRLNSKFAAKSDDVLKSKKGDNGDITFLLLSLLKSVGIDGVPVIFSTRENGKLQENYPLLSQFNYVLARVQIGSQQYYLDATDPLRTFELLPIKVLNTKGLVIKKDTVEWVILSSPQRYSTSSIASLIIRDDGSCTGSLEKLLRDYASLSVRRTLNEKKEINFAKEQFKTDEISISIDSVRVEGKDDITLPLTLKAWISSPNYAQQNGDFMYINPHVFDRLSENPFKSETRDFPIDYTHAYEQTAITNVFIPENFEIKESLINRTLIVGSNDVRFTRRIQLDTACVQIINKFEVRNAQIEPAQYARLKELYTQMISIQAQQIVLERKKVQEPARKIAVPGTTSKKKIRK